MHEEDNTLEWLPHTADKECQTLTIHFLPKNLIKDWTNKSSGSIMIFVIHNVLMQT